MVGTIRDIFNLIFKKPYGMNLKKNVFLCSMNVFVCLTVIFAIVTSVEAVPVTINFSGSALDGPLAGTNYSGFFTYDDAAFTYPSSNSLSDAPGLELDLSFSMGPLNFNSSNASLGLLDFDATGAVDTWFMGGDADGIWWATVSPESQVVYDFGVGGTGGQYTVEGVVGAFLLSSPVTSPVPEPATMLLFGTGLVGLAGLRKKK